MEKKDTDRERDYLVKAPFFKFIFLYIYIWVSVGHGSVGIERLTVTLPLSTFIRTSGGGEAQPTLTFASLIFLRKGNIEHIYSSMYCFVLNVTLCTLCHTFLSYIITQDVCYLKVLCTNLTVDQYNTMMYTV